MEVIVFGGGEHYRDVFNAVAMMAGAGSMDSLLRLAMVLGLAMGIVKAAFDFDVGKILKWFLMAVVIYGVLWVPKVQVQVIDKFNPGLTGGAVANVPLGVGFTAAVTSQVGNRVIELTETTFADPADVRYSETGMIFGAKVFERMRTVRITNPRFDQNMQAFVRGCIYYDVLTGYYSMGQLANADDIWQYVTVTRPQNPGRSIEYVDSAGATTIVTCQQAAASLDGEWAAEIPNAQRMFEKRVRPSLAEASLQSENTSEIQTLHTMVFGSSKSATEVFKQLLMANSVRRGMSSFAAEAGGSAMDVVAETQADIQTRNTQKLLGSVAEKAIVVLKIVVDLLFIGMFPVLFPAFLLPGVGTKMMQGYLTGFLYLQLWGPMYVILNKIIMGRAVTDTAAAAYIPGESLGLKIANLESIGSLNADISAVAGAMTMMIPVLAGMLTKGAMAIGGAGESLMRQFSSGAEAAGAAATTGNFSFGNSAFDNHSWNNLSANRHQTSALLDRGNASVVDGQLNTHSFGSAGGYSFQGARSTPAVGMNVAQGVSNALVSQASQSREMGRQIDQTYSEAQSRTRQQIAEASTTYSRGGEFTSSRGTENRASFASMASELDSVSRQLSETTGMNINDAKSVVGRVAAEASGGISTPGSGVSPLSAGAKLSGGVEGSRSSTTTRSAAENKAYELLSNSQFSRRAEQATAETASSMWTERHGKSDQFRLANSDVFATSQSVAKSVRDYENEARAFTQRAEIAQTQSAQLQEAYDHQFVGWARQRLANQEEATGPIGAQRFGEIMNPTNAQDRDLLNELAQSFFLDLGKRIQAPPEIAAAANMESSVSAPTVASGAELRAGHAAGAGRLDQLSGAVDASLGGRPGPITPVVDLSPADGIRAQTDAAGAAARSAERPDFQRGMARGAGELLGDVVGAGAGAIDAIANAGRAAGQTIGSAVTGGDGTRATQQETGAARLGGRVAK